MGKAGNWGLYPLVLLSKPNLRLLLVEKTQAIISWLALMMSVDWQPVIERKIKLATGLAVQEPDRFRLASPNDNIQGEVLACSAHSSFACIVLANQPLVSLLILGVVAWKELRVGWSPASFSSTLTGRQTWWLRGAPSTPNSPLNSLCHPLRP